LQLSEEATLLLYRAAQEAVRNAVGHGKAGRVWVHVTAQDGRASLLVSDDGGGFSVDEQVAKPAAGHFGLRLLGDQARDAGGKLDIDSAPGHGTRLRLEVPAR